MTPEMNHLSMWGAAGLNAYVHKLGRGWGVEIAGISTPMVFKSKTEALKHAEARIYAQAGRLDWTPYLYTAAVRPPRIMHLANYD